MPPASSPPLRRTFAAPADFLAAYEAEIARGGLWLPGAEPPPGAHTALAPVQVTIEVRGQAPVVVDAHVATIAPGHGLALVFEAEPPALTQLAERLRAGPALPPGPPAPAGQGNLADRLRRLSVPEKVSLALVADREERFALLRDPNKTVHLYVLKNPRIGLDEVQYAIKSPSISPDALKYVSEHREWSNDANVRLSLVRNPRTPTSIALRVMELLPEREIRNFAKGNGRPEIVQAARRKVTQ
jgi:hypothetical protein